MVVESAPTAMVMVNQTGRITLVNAQTEQLFGYSRRELLGQPVELLMPERFRGSHPGHLNAFYTKPEAYSPSARSAALGHDLYARRKDGSEFPVDIGLNPIPTKQELLVLSTIVDLTERRVEEERIRRFNEMLELKVAARTTQLRNANIELEAFAYAASHDLKAPLRVIDNCSRWIEEDLQQYLSGDTRENMNMMRSRIKRMQKLLDDLLEYARIGQTTDTKYNETIAGDELMHNVLELLAPDGFTVTVSPGFARIQVRTMPLQQILMNLISNAMKHHDKKQGCIDVTVEDRGALYAFAVRDDGPGIPSRFHQEIFKMFQTLKSKDQVDGSGMGLAMVRKHVELFGGEIDVESSEGKGSTFRFTLPKQPTPVADHSADL
jgi:PAS domain S-box-containing protein